MNNPITRRPLFGPASFYREVLAVAIPVMAQQAIQSLVSLIDNFMVAGLGDAKMAGVNVANQVNFVYLVVMMTLSGAGGIYMSQFRGAKDEEGMQQAYRFKAIMTMGFSALYFALCQSIPAAMISAMTMGNAAQAEIVSHGAAYLRLVSWMFIPMGLSQSIGTAYREIGKPGVPLTISVCATLVNTFFNWVLIYGNLGAPRLEIAGAAIATNIARGAEVVVFVIYARTHAAPFFVPLKRLFKARWSLFREILGKSSLMLLSETSWVISETVTTALYNGRGGAEVVAGMSAGWAIANIFFLVFTGIHVSTGVVVGGLLGANKLEEARVKARWIMSGSVVGGAVVALAQVASIAAVPIVFMNLTKEATVVTRGLLLVISAYLPLWSLLNAQFAVSRSGGDTMMGVVVDVGVTYLLFIPAAFALALLTPIGPVAMYGLVKLSDFAKWLVAHRWLKKERWLRNLASPVAP
ncbi:MAG: polysaccharide biosynthesis C-terminal domain-containing protein [Spirochaetes bacterium]|nr:polysaccharide biosynthesis C-terminal domain-containing protein [Spirochaetota bacterium]MBU1081520.1 polysaccharide biosynthesis C-terminal domain-containing protein [Spirochaetota bacterium]